MGVTVPDLENVKTYANTLRETVKSGQDLSVEQKKQIVAMQRFADVQRQDLTAQQSKFNIAKQQGDLEEKAAASVRNRVIEQQKADLEALAAAKQRSEAEEAVAAKASAQETQQIQSAITHNAAIEARLRTLGQQNSTLYAESEEYRKQLDLLLQKKLAGEQLTATEQTQLQTLISQTKQLQSQVSAAGSDATQGAQNFWQRRFGWFIAGSTFYGTLQAARDIADNMEQIESAMNVLRRVSDEPLTNYAEIQQQLLDLGVQYGQVWSQVSDVAIKWAQAGYSMKDTIELTRTSLLALNTAELNSTQATQGMIAIMAQWEMTSKDLLPVIDKINKTADDYAVSSADLIDGLSRSSGAAKMMGMSIEDAISVLTVLRESSGRTGREVGNALNSILAFMQKAKSLDVMKSMGIDVGTDTTFRNAMDMWADIAARWPALSQTQQDALADAAEAAGLYGDEIKTVIENTEAFTQAQQRDIAVANAGTYRRNYFMALMANFSKVLEVTTNMENALGYSERENAKHMETYAAKVDQLKAAWEAFSDTFAQSGLLDLLKGNVDALRWLIDGFNGLPAPVKAAAGALVEYAAALSMLKLAQKTFGGIGSITDLFKEAANTTQQAGFLAATSTSALGSLTKWIAGLSSWQAAGIIAASGALISLIGKQQEYNKFLEEAATRYYEVESALSKVKEGTAEYEVALKNQKEVLNEIGEKFPELIAKYDSFGNVVGLLTDKFNQLNPSMKNALAVASGDTVSEMSRMYNNTLDQLAAATERFNELSASGPPKPESGTRADIQASASAYYTWKAQMGRSQKDVDRLKEQAENYRVRLDALTSGGATGTTTGGSAGGGGGASDIDSVKARYNLLKESVLSLDLALIEVRKNLSLVDAEESALGDTLEDTNKRSDLAAEKARLLARQNDLLSSVNENLNSRLSSLNQLMSEASQVEGEDWLTLQKNIGSEIKSVTQSLADNTVQIRENQLAIQNSSKEVQKYYDEIKEAQKEQYYESIETQRDSFEHQVALGLQNRNQQISFLRNLLLVYASDAEKRREIELDLRDLYKEGLEEQMELVKKAYDERIDMIDKETEARVKSLQDQIDALDELSEDNSRTEAEKEHNKKILELQEKWQYENARLGKEHEKNKVEITKQIEEENYRWEQQQRQWSIQDQKENLQDQIKNVQDAAKKEKEALQKQWEEAKKSFDNNISAIISTAAVFQESWYQTGLAWGQQLVKGFTEASASMINSAVYSIDAPKASSDSGILARSHELLAAKKQWDAANAIGNKAEMEAAAALGAKIRASGPTLDPNMELDTEGLEEKIKNYPKAHTGALVAKSGVANLLKDELVLSPRFSQTLMRLADILERRSVMGSPSQNIHIDKLMTIEKVDASKPADVEALKNAVFKAVQALQKTATLSFVP